MAGPSRINRPVQGEGRATKVMPRMKVLLVEDHEDTAETTARLLRLCGYDVDVASDGKTALERAEAQHPEAILLDLGLPGMDGYEVAKRLRQQKTDNRALIIAMTGYGQKEDCIRSYEVGIDLHLTKPVGIDELRRFLERYQEMRHGNRAEVQMH